MSQGAKQSLPGNRTRTGIVGIESVLYGVDDVAVSTRFFTDFGLELLEQGQHGATFGTPERTSVRVRRNDDIDLPPPVEPGPPVREIVWGVENAAALEGIAADLSRDREVIRTEDGGIRTLDETGYTIGFRVTDRSPVFLEPQTLNTVGTVLRRNERFTFYDRATPQHIGHIVLYCPNYEEQIRFYTERLGFMVSDVVRGSGAFLRCSTDQDRKSVV